MSSDATYLVQKLWNYSSILRDDGLSYGDYVEQLTYLLYLKMDYERTQPPFSWEPNVPVELNWDNLLTRDGLELEKQYKHTLEELGKQTGMLGTIFRKAQNKISDPAKLRRLIVDLINKEHWLGLNADVKGDAYEGLLEKNAKDSKSGAGQYFTPRSVIRMMTELMNPSVTDTICDPACGTGGFLLSAFDHVVSNNPNMSKDEKRNLKLKNLTGHELVDSVTRLCAMNLSLHGIGDDENVPVQTRDSLASHPNEYYDIVLANPPFGRKSSVKIITSEGEIINQNLIIERDDFWTSTSNKQLMFTQHIVSILKIGGRAAIVLPDNVLFEAGSGEVIRKKLLETCNLHTILRLPTGIFYAPGVKSNVVFLEKCPPSEKFSTQSVWVYDLRTNTSFTPVQRPLAYEDLSEFMELYQLGDLTAREQTYSVDEPDGRWRCFSLEEILGRDNSTLTMRWVKDLGLIDFENLPSSIELSGRIETDLTEAISLIASVSKRMG